MFADARVKASRKTSRSRSWCAVVLGAVALAVLCPDPAQAHRRDFAFTQDWKQPSKGEKELESKSTYKGTDNTFVQEFELEYGVTDRFSVAPYVVFEREAGGSLKYHEAKLETRLQLGKYKTGRILPGLYLEYAKPRNEKGEIEGKLIFSRYGSNGDDLSLNLIAERSLEHGSEWEKEVSLGYARSVGKRGMRLGGEVIHEFEDRVTKAGPTLAFAPTDSVWLVVGYAHPLNHRDDERGDLRVNLEYEF